MEHLTGDLFWKNRDEVSMLHFVILPSAMAHHSHSHSHSHSHIGLLRSIVSMPSCSTILGLPWHLERAKYVEMDVGMLFVMNCCSLQAD